VCLGRKLSEVSFHVPSPITSPTVARQRTVVARVEHACSISSGDRPALRGGSAAQRLQRGGCRSSDKKLRAADGRERTFHRLCPIVGCTVEELRDRISERELIAWQVYWTIEPPLADRIEIAIGILASLMANINRDAKRRAEPFEPRDFMVDWLGRLEEKPEQEGMSPEEILSAFDRLIRAQELRYGTR
jgi:hypothetical protein